MFVNRPIELVPQSNTIEFRYEVNKIFAQYIWTIFTCTLISASPSLAPSRAH